MEARILTRQRITRAEYERRVALIMKPAYLYTPADFERERAEVLVRAGISSAPNGEVSDTKSYGAS